MSNRSIGLDDRLHEYVVAHGVREHPLLVRLREETAGLPQRNMQIAPEQGQFMAWLVRLMQAERILEIGTFTGYSSLAMALAQSDKGRILTCDVSEEWTAIARRYWKEAGVDSRIELRLGPAVDTLKDLAQGPAAGQWDFVFIDADKESYNEYWTLCLPLLRAGGVIAFDNTLWNGRVADPSVQTVETAALRELNSALKKDETVDLTLVPIGDGLTLVRKRHA